LPASLFYPRLAAKNTRLPRDDTGAAVFISGRQLGGDITATQIFGKRRAHPGNHSTA